MLSPVYILIQLTLSATTFILRVGACDRFHDHRLTSHGQASNRGRQGGVVVCDIKRRPVDLRACSPPHWVRGGWGPARDRSRRASVAMLALVRSPISDRGSGGKGVKQSLALSSPKGTSGLPKSSWLCPMRKSICHSRPLTNYNCVSRMCTGRALYQDPLYLLLEDILKHN